MKRKKTEGANLAGIEEGFKQLIEEFRQGEVIMENYDPQDSQGALLAKFQDIAGRMHALNQTVDDSLEGIDITVFKGLVNHIDGGKNIEKYDSEREEDANRSLKIMKTKMAAFGGFRDAFQAALKDAYPEEFAEYEMATSSQDQV